MKKISIICLLNLSAVIFLTFCKVDYSIAQSPEYMKGFPVYLDSISFSSWATPPIIDDFNLDGKNEILFAQKTGGFISKIYLIQSSGLPEIGWPVFLTGILVVTAAGDVNGDKYIDIVLRSSDSIFVFDHSANSLPGFPVYFPSGFTKIMLYDLDNDNKLEIITIAGNKAIVFNSNGSVREGWPVNLPGIDSSRIYSSDISAADLNNDDVPEIIIPSSYCQSGGNCTINGINIFEPDGELYLSTSIISDSNYFFSATPASVYFRNDSGFIAVNSIYEVNDGSFTRTSIYNQDGVLTERIYTNSPFGTAGSISIGDLNSDNIHEISFGYQNISTYLFSTDGTLFNGWPVNINSYYLRSALMLNFNNLKLIATSESYADTTGGYTDNHGYIKFFDLNGIQLNWSPLRLKGHPQTSGTICDLNRDGIMDMVVSSTYITQYSPLQWGTMIHAWSFPGVQYNPSAQDWTMYGHDRYRSFQYGFIPPDEPTGIQPIFSSIPNKFYLHQNFPNPFNPYTTIKFDITSNNESKKTKTNLIIYDALGRKLKTLLHESLTPGTYSFIFDGSNYSSGVYYYKLITNDFSESRKMLLLK